MYEIGDPGRPVDVVFMHANGFNARTYLSIFSPLSAQSRILLIDLQGHGGSPQRVVADGRINSLDLVLDLVGLLRVMAPGRRVVLSGHSLGGCVAILAADQAPEFAAGLVLFDPVIISRSAAEETLASGGPISPEPAIALNARSRRSSFASKQQAFDRYRGRGAFANWPDEVLRDYVHDGFEADTQGGVKLVCAPEWEASNFVAQANDTWGALERIQAPVSIYRAELGSTCQLVSPCDLPLRRGRLSVETVPGSTHFLPMERPDLVRSKILAESCQTPPTTASF